LRRDPHGGWLAAAALVAALPGAAGGQAAPGLAWVPAIPVEGTVVWVTAPHAVLHGTIDGEPLHFEADTTGASRALGAVALGSGDSIAVTVLFLDHFGFPQGDSIWMPVARRVVGRERIRIDRRFTRPPDSALAERIATERAAVRDAFSRSHGRPRLWDQPFVRPRSSRVTSRFGTRRIVNGRDDGRHWGVDLDGTVGAPVRAANRGVVVLAGEYYYGGRAVYVDHGAGLVTGYLHLSAVVVAPGDTVAAGQLVGRVGATGRVTGPHLHWLAQYGRRAVDPLDLIRVEAFPLPGSGSGR
jgi:hypothetical protein